MFKTTTWPLLFWDPIILVAVSESSSLIACPWLTEDTIALLSVAGPSLTSEFLITFVGGMASGLSLECSQLVAFLVLYNISILACPHA